MGVCWAAANGATPSAATTRAIRGAAASAVVFMRHLQRRRPACAGRGCEGLLAWSDDLAQVIRRALDPFQMRILQTAVVIHRHVGVVALILDQQLDRLLRVLGLGDRL